MIKHINLRRVTSYSPTTSLQVGPLAKVNMFYGQNGTGKTTIGNYLQDPHDLIYSDCSVQPPNPERELVVYNHNFMDSHFKESSQPGVFTLNEGNIEAEKALLAAEAELTKLAGVRRQEVEAGKALDETKKQKRSAYLDDLWSLRKEYEDSNLKYCLTVHTKGRLAEKVEKLPLEPTTDTFELLAEEAAELQSASGQELFLMPMFNFSERDVEADPLLQEVILGSENSYLSEVINELGNSDWIKSSFRFVDQQSDVCPFCQQDLPGNFFEELGKVFDQTYQKRVEILTELKDRYESGFARLQLQWRRPEYQAPEFAKGIAALEILLQSNRHLLSDKLKTPSTPIHLKPSNEVLAGLNALVKVEQEKTSAFNLKVKNKIASLDKINTRFWTCFRRAKDAAISKAKAEQDELDSQMAMRRQAIEDLKLEANAQKHIISDNRAKITNIDQSIDSINASLHTLGLKGFQVVNEEGDLPRYRLERPVQQQGVFKSLSEGEKTLISFLYFLEVCNGDLDSSSGKLKTNRVIVIDDPISSLSHNYVYDIASLIQRRVLKPKDRFMQVFILTHNLFFFHEMLKHLGKGADVSLFRITKAQFTCISPMKPSDVQNDYQSFWQAIKDAQAGKTSASVIPNMMRNILEHYFTFVHRQDELAQALQELADEDLGFKALNRYINRESHSDAVNLTDFGEIDPNQYVERFRQVFVRTGFEQHFEKMMA